MKSKETDAAEADDLFEMANLYPRATGLPMTVWVSPRKNAGHDVRIKVNMAHGNQMSPANTAVVAVRPSPHMIEGSLSTADQRAVLDWITVNSAAITAYWEADIDTVQLARALQPLPPHP